jgi:hypothetical protein
VFVLSTLEKSGPITQIDNFNFREDVIDLPFLADFAGPNDFFDITNFVQVAERVEGDGFDLLVKATSADHAAWIPLAHFKAGSLNGDDPVTVMWQSHMVQVQAMPLAA